LKLAALTVGLLCVLLLVSSTVVYVTTQQALLRSLDGTLKSRADNPPRYIHQFVVGQIPPVIFSGQNGTPQDTQDSNGVFYTVLDPTLAILGAIGPFNPPLLDRATAERMLKTGDLSLYGQVTRDGADYRVYTEAATAEDGTLVAIVQTSISEKQYEESLKTLLRVLLSVAGFGILASAGISIILARRALSPIRVAMRRQRDFVADAAHELRTPLTIMRTAAELGLTEESPGDQQRALEQTLAQNNHLTRLVESLSLLARADSGAVSLERAPLDLAGLVHESVEAVEMLAEERGIHLSATAQGGARVQGDIGRLRQLMLILLDNALKYTPSGGTVAVSVDAQGNSARLQVRDTGPGIDPQDLPRLFDRFYRADRARTGEGTGLGLAIGRWIAEAHGGRIMASNAPGGGAVFTVTIPLTR
jgi:signal transduction histidine kinase